MTDDRADIRARSRLSEALGDAYTIEGEIGRGGMGVVYRARDERLQAPGRDQGAPARAGLPGGNPRALHPRGGDRGAAVPSPHRPDPLRSVRATAWSTSSWGYVDGESLGGRLKRRGRLPAEEARRIMKETADALCAAHALSVIHRDIKPDNILLEGTRGRVMVTDFGIAKALSATTGATLTGAGVAIGTPQFMSPEQAAGESEIDGRSDLYSLGVVTYQMLTGELPFNAPTVAGILMKQITERPRRSSARAIRRARGSVARGGALPGEGSGEPLAHGRRAAPRAREPDGHRLPADRPDPGPVARSWSGRPARAPAGDPARGSRPLAANAAGAQLPAPPPRPRGLALPARPASERASRRMERRDDDTPLPVPDTGEPRIVQKIRAHFARWAAVSAGCFMVNIATGITEPWFLFPMMGMGIGLLTNYAKLWQAGYTWRDVLNRPPAPDALRVPAGKGGKARGRSRTARPTTSGYTSTAVAQVYGDRMAINKLMERLTPSERKMLPEDVQETVDGSVQPGSELARTLHAMDSNIADRRIWTVSTSGSPRCRGSRTTRSGPGAWDCWSGSEKAIQDLGGRREQIASQLESCILAMQNVRFDLLRLRSAGRGRRPGRPHQGDPAGPGPFARRGQRHCRGERDPGSVGEVERTAPLVPPDPPGNPRSVCP